MHPLTQENINLCAPVLSPQYFKQIHFKRLTQTHGAKHYHLSLNHILSSESCRFSP